MDPGGRGAISAAELKAELDRRLAADPEYRQQVEAVETERAERARFLRDAEQPVIADLAAHGVELESVWDLHKNPDAFPTAIPVLLDHLARDYPDGVLMRIGAGLDHKSARDWWPQLTALYRDTTNQTVRDRAAAVLSNVAARAHYDDLLSFLADESLGNTRVYFLRPVNRIGNRIAPGKGRAVVQSLATDPTFGKEAAAILAGRSRND
jgi:hypothetical protein